MVFLLIFIKVLSPVSWIIKLEKEPIFLPVSEVWIFRTYLKKSFCLISALKPHSKSSKYTSIPAGWCLASPWSETKIFFLKQVLHNCEVRLLIREYQPDLDGSYRKNGGLRSKARRKPTKKRNIHLSMWTRAFWGGLQRSPWALDALMRWFLL